MRVRRHRETEKAMFSGLKLNKRQRRLKMRQTGKKKRDMRTSVSQLRKIAHYTSFGSSMAL